LQAHESIFHLEPTTAKASIYFKSQIRVPSQLRKKKRKLRKGNEDKGNTLGKEPRSTLTELAAFLRLRTKNARPTRTVEGGEGMIYLS